MRLNNMMYIFRGFGVLGFWSLQTSLEGALQATISALLASDLRIAEMRDATYDLHLVGRTEAAHGVEKVYATPANHALCDGFLAGREPRLAVVDMRSPRMACELAAQETAAAAVANETFAAQFGLVVHQRSILDRVGDRVRYALVCPRPSGRTGATLNSWCLPSATRRGRCSTCCGSSPSAGLT